MNSLYEIAPALRRVITLLMWDRILRPVNGTKDISLQPVPSQVSHTTASDAGPGCSFPSTSSASRASRVSSVGIPESPVPPHVLHWVLTVLII